MREIKFRAWDKYGKQMIAIFDSTSQNEWYMPNMKGGRWEYMQYTGLKDRNGKEIYEGDIVVKSGYMWFDGGHPNYRGTVEWIYSQWQVVAHCVNSEKSGISDGTNEGLNEEGFEEGKKSDWEVIGNIYQNPELLEAK